MMSTILAALLTAAYIWGYSGVQFTISFAEPDAEKHASAHGTMANCHTEWNPEYADWPFEKLLPIAIHEYGHCISIPHSPFVQSIMYHKVWTEGGLSWGQPNGQRILPSDRMTAWWALRDPWWGMFGTRPGHIVSAGIVLPGLSVD